MRTRSISSTIRFPAGLLVVAALAACSSLDTDTGVGPVEATGSLDQDGDTVLDVHEGEADPDGDRVPAWLDLDSDDDGLSDALEAGGTTTR